MNVQFPRLIGTAPDLPWCLAALLAIIAWAVVF
jgi:hypothetical protein